MRVSVIDSSSSSASGKKSDDKGKSIARSAVDGSKTSAADAESVSRAAMVRRKAVPFISDEVAAVLDKYLILVNVVVCCFLALIEVGQGRTWGEGMMIGGGYVPGFVLVVVMFARRELRVVDLGELEKLRYRTQAGLASR